MGHFRSLNFGFEITPPPPPGTTHLTKISPLPLFSMGMNIPVGISTATVFRNSPSNILPISSIFTMAHLDTGASVTSIDINLAKHLELIPTGISTSRTAAGSQSMPTYVIDLVFRAELSPFPDLQIGSCDLGFDLSRCLSNPNDPENLGILLGRDIMSRWNIVWNGPTSIVFISD